MSGRSGLFQGHKLFYLWPPPDIGATTALLHNALIYIFGKKAKFVAILFAYIYATPPGMALKEGRGKK